MCRGYQIKIILATSIFCKVALAGINLLNLVG
jgi:hypothetical protein